MRSEKILHPREYLFRFGNITRATLGAESLEPAQLSLHPLHLPGVELRPVCREDPHLARLFGP